MQKIEVNGKSYPMRMTMGALRRFKAETGKDVSEIGNDLSAVGVLLWACVASACKADGIEFSMDCDTFADFLSMEDVNAFASSITNEQKKTTAKR